MIPDKKTILFILGLAAVVTIIAHLLLTSQAEKKRIKMFEVVHGGLVERSEAAAPKMREYFSANPGKVVALGHFGYASAGGQGEYAFASPVTSTIITFRIPRNAPDPAQVANSIGRHPDPRVAAYDPSNGAEGRGLILHTIPFTPPGGK